MIQIRIEVKSTPDSENLTFPMSYEEFKAALDDTHKKGKLHIYRVFNEREAIPIIKKFDFIELYKNDLINYKGKDLYLTLPSEKK